MEILVSAFGICSGLFNKHNLYVVAKRRPSFCERYTCVVGWIIIQTVCLCCLKPGVPVLDLHVFGRRNDKSSLYIS